jgi:hypothetical protein
VLFRSKKANEDEEKKEETDNDIKDPNLGQKIDILG